MSCIDRIIHEMTLREPQADSLRVFGKLMESIDLHQGQDVVKQGITMNQLRLQELSTIMAGRFDRLPQQPLVFDTEYARITFALATGIGKTRLMGAIAAFLFLEEKAKHFVFLAPSNTILTKMKAESVQSHPKYLFQGLTGFPLPQVIHAENIETYHPEQEQILIIPSLFILSPGQIRPRSGSEAERRLRQESETFGPSFVEYLAQLDDLVVFLDEGHRYGQDARTNRAWAQAISDLNPKIVIEMTATPSNPNTVACKYDLRQALLEGLYIKNVTAITEQRQATYSDEEWDKHTLLEGFRRLKCKEAAQHAYTQNNPNAPAMKPITLISAQDTTHAAWIEQWLTSDDFIAEVNNHILLHKPIEERLTTNEVKRVDITQSEVDIAQILTVENPDDTTKIVINVGMLKEGWDVNNVYVVIPLRAMISSTLAIQTIGRGLRLPFGRRIGDEELDTLDVLTFGRETVQQVIDQAKLVGISVTERSGTGGDMVFRTIQPSRSTAIELPNINLRVVNPPSLQDLHVDKHVHPDFTQSTSVTRVSAVSGISEVIENAIDINVSNPTRRMAQLLCRNIDEIAGQEDEATRIFTEYLTTSGCDTVDKINRAIQVYGSQIYDDVKTQILTLIEGVQTEYESGGENIHIFEFSPAIHAVVADNSEVDKSSAIIPRDKQRLIVGWQRSLYLQNKFDTQEELKIAKILDNTDGITWVRNPVRQFGIQTQIGYHYPDLIAIKSTGFIFIEVKDPEELTNVNSDAHKKGKASTEWCRLATASSDKSYDYWAIPNNLVNECTTIEELERKRYVFHEVDNSNRE